MPDITPIKLIKKRTGMYLSLLLLITIISTIIASQLGALPINIFKLMQGEIDNYLFKIWLDIRLPRVLLALLIGASLALSGTILQGLFKNPLADPGLLGISSGSALMVGITILLMPLLTQQLYSLSPSTLQFITQYLIVGASFVGGMTVASILLLFSIKKRTTLLHLLLLGIAINAINGGAMGVFTYLSTDNQLRQFTLWTMGSLGTANWHSLSTAAIIIIPIMLLSLKYTKALNLMQLGHEQAFYMGINVKRTQWQLLGLVSLLTGISVSLTGIIGFIGLVIPHLMRMQISADNRFLFPATLLGGGLFLLVADTLARTVVIPAEMPVGIITSLVGGPYFVYLIMKVKTAHF
ncbi:FecCD family ABC transporter permease [Thorsellia kenyensis]|uniref:FecCD family ABC transporter permease n=1 Tax=Thorsellia kenyensis TaxID=1549888 RepID=A0ABV6CA28_9GAMM